MKSINLKNLTAVVATCATATLSAAERPNILWISAEDTSACHWSCYGNPVAQMPTVDSLANIGIRYSNAFSTAPISSPTRAGIISGMYQTSIGCHNMMTETYMRGEFGTERSYSAVPAHYIKAFTEYLRTAGYYCTNNQKTHYQFCGKDEDVPRSIWDETSRQAHYRNREDKSQPFFAVFNTNSTHGTKKSGDGVDEIDLSKIEVPPCYIDNEETRKIYANHYNGISQFDSYVAKRLEELRADGSADNTIIFLWSDHGSGFMRDKRWLYDAGTHIPLIVIFPKSMKGEVCDQVVSSVDFGPTVLSLAGVQVPLHMEGIPFLGDQKGEPRKYAFAARDREDDNYDMVRSVRDKRYLYIRNFYPSMPYIGFVKGRNTQVMMRGLQKAHLEGTLTPAQALWFAPTRPVEELYDIERDPHCVVNLAGDAKQKSRLLAMRAAQMQWADETGDMGLMNEDELYRHFFPNGKQEKTLNPSFMVNYTDKERFNHLFADTELTITYPAMIDYRCPTQGASMAYRCAKDGERMPKNWKIYNGARHLERGVYNMELVAQRYGYKASDVVKLKLTVK